MLISLPESGDAALDTGRQQIVDALKARYPNPVVSTKADVVGPTVGKQLEKQAGLATLYSLIGMLIYLWFRFELIYGVAAVVAVFHDTLITVGFFALTGQEISLTVIAAILTLVGYSMNDTIVVFDRIRENLRLSRREGLTEVVNRSINQTLSRTVLTSGLTFLTVLALFIFGGEVLRGFSLRWWWVFLSARIRQSLWLRQCWWLTRTGVLARARRRCCLRQSGSRLSRAASTWRGRSALLDGPLCWAGVVLS